MIIVGFQYETDARRFWDAMRRERLAEYSLSLHPEKTRLIEFGRFAADQRARRGLGKPETFNFLGFTFICGRSRRGRFALKRKSRGDRMRATLQEIKKEMQRPMHQPIPEQGKWLRQVATARRNRKDRSRDDADNNRVDTTAPRIKSSSDTVNQVIVG
jgi:RNA-directed DNA polymerase